MANKAAFDAAGSGWYNAGGNLVIAKSASLGVTSAKVFAFTVGQALVSQTFTCTNGTTTVGQSVYAVRSAPARRLVGGERRQAQRDELPDVDGHRHRSAAGHLDRVEVRQAAGGQLPEHR